MNRLAYFFALAAANVATTPLAQAQNSGSSARSPAAQSGLAIQGRQNRPPRACTTLPVLRSTHLGPAWLDGIAPYEFSSNVTARNKILMLRAMTEWENVSAVHFVPRTNQTDYIFIQDSASNSSFVGRVGGKQIVNIFNWNYAFIVAHELGHALGFHHEQTRPDRDTYVRIESSNIKSGTKHNFAKQGGAKAWGLYDFDSVMHYGWNDFAIDRTKPTITVLPPNQAWQKKIGQRTHLSIGDIDGMRSVYGGVATILASRSSTANQGNSGSQHPDVSAGGRFIAFDSGSSNLVSGDTNGKADVFVRDRQTRRTQRSSVSSSAAQGNGSSEYPSISSDGNHVVFESLASNLVSGDTNGTRDVFIHDRRTGRTTRVSVSSSDDQGNSYSQEADVSGNGRIVVFASNADNLVLGDTNRFIDIFAHDRNTGTTARVNVSSSGAQGNSNAFYPSISANGQFAVFTSWASNLVSNDTNTAPDIFVHDRTTGRTTRVSVNSGGGQANSRSFESSVSADGRYVAFDSAATNLISGDTNSAWDIFVHDQKTGKTIRVSVNSTGIQGNGHSTSPSISANGRYVTFSSRATNIVSIDTNGKQDVFIHDRDTGVTSMLSTTSTGTQGNQNSGNPRVSADGRHVTFDSAATNLISGDTNSAQDIFVRERLSAQTGSSNHGSGCQGSLGTPTIFSRARARSDGNGAFSILVSAGRPSSTAFLGLATQSATIAVGAGCTIYIRLPQFATLSGQTDSWGTARFSLPIPTNATLKGVIVYAQGFVSDPNKAWNGLSFTNGLGLKVQ